MIAKNQQDQEMMSILFACLSVGRELSPLLKREEQQALISGVSRLSVEGATNLHPPSGEETGEVHVQPGDGDAKMEAQGGGDLDEHPDTLTKERATDTRSLLHRSIDAQTFQHQQPKSNSTANRPLSVSEPFRVRHVVHAKSLGVSQETQTSDAAMGGTRPTSGPGVSIPYNVKHSVHLDPKVSLTPKNDAQGYGGLRYNHPKGYPRSATG